MPTSTPDPVLAVDDLVSLIRARMQEKRIFEARFLCRQLAGELGATEKKGFEQELTAILTQVEQLRRRAQELVAAGRKEQAQGVYGEIAAIAVDVPGVVEEQRALESAEILVARIAGQTAPLARPEAAEAIRIDVQAQPPTVEGAPHDRKKTRRRVWLAGALLGILAVLALLLLWRGGIQPSASPSSHPQAAQSITIRPLDIPTPPAEQPQQPQPTAEPVLPAVKPESAQDASKLKLGVLQVEPSARR